MRAALWQIPSYTGTVGPDIQERFSQGSLSPLSSKILALR